MKTFEQVTQQFERDMKELGADGYLVAVKNPDGQDMYWHVGGNILWQLGASTMLQERIKDICSSIHYGEPEDEGEDWQG